MSIRDCIVSRWPDGWLVEADYSQLEIQALANLSGDSQLIQDLLEGKDLHRAFAAQALGKPESKVTDHERRMFKTLSFLIQYGGGPAAAEKQLGITKRQAINFIDAYYERYPEVAIYHNQLELEVESNSKITTAHTVSGLPQSQGWYENPITHRRHTFATYDNKYRPGHTKYSPTQIKNYQVQGYATGDIVPIALGRMVRRFFPHRDVTKLIATVHDSILADTIDCEVAPAVANTMIEVMKSVDGHLIKYYGYKQKVPLQVGVKAGRTWGKMLDINEYTWYNNRVTLTKT